MYVFTQTMQKFRCHYGMLDNWIRTTHRNISIKVSVFSFKWVIMSVWQCLTRTERTTNTMSCAPYVWQYCWKAISAVAYICYLVHCLLRHEITLHVLCGDKYSTSMQQFCHPGNNSYKQEPYSFQAYMHQRRRAQSNFKQRAILLRFGTIS